VPGRNDHGTGLADARRSRRALLAHLRYRAASAVCDAVSSCMRHQFSAETITKVVDALQDHEYPHI
jgi:hypothetical protein